MRLITDEALAVATVYAEARGEPYNGQIGVAEVICNRTARKYSSDGTVASTVLWPAQFSAWNTRDPNRVRAMLIDDDDPVVQQCMAAWRAAVAGSDLTHGALMYVNPRTATGDLSWIAQCVETACIGQHRFFRPV